jgi:hypothetical protein
MAAGGSAGVSGGAGSTFKTGAFNRSATPPVPLARPAGRGPLLEYSVLAWARAPGPAARLA